MEDACLICEGGVVRDLSADHSWLLIDCKNCRTTYKIIVHAKLVSGWAAQRPADPTQLKRWIQEQNEAGEAWPVVTQNRYEKDERFQRL